MQDSLELAVLYLTIGLLLLGATLWQSYLGDQFLYRGLFFIGKRRSSLTRQISLVRVVAQGWTALVSLAAFANSAWYFNQWLR